MYSDYQTDNLINKYFVLYCFEMGKGEGEEHAFVISLAYNSPYPHLSTLCFTTTIAGPKLIMNETSLSQLVFNKPKRRGSSILMAHRPSIDPTKLIPMDKYSC